MRSLPLQPDDRPLVIGPRLRAARHARGLTIDELATTTGLTKGFLSRVERDKTSPSVSTLVSICNVLSIPIGSIFDAPDVRFVPAGTGPVVTLGGVDADERLLSPRSEDRVQVIRSVLGPVGNGGDDLYALAADVDVVHVIAGGIEVEFSDSSWRLGPGDTLTFNGREPHNWRVVGDEPADVLWVLVPAAWGG